jgi:hypothetical protein
VILGVVTDLYSYLLFTAFMVNDVLPALKAVIPMVQFFRADTLHVCGVTLATPLFV